MSSGGYIKHVRRFIENRHGQFGLIAAILAPVLLGLTGGAIDLVVYQNQQALMQNSADFAALAATKEASLKGWTEQTAKAVAKTIVAGNLQGKAFSDATYFNTEVSVDEARKSVTVTLDMDQHAFFVLGYFRRDPQIRVKSTARAMGETSLCVIGLDKNSASTVKLNKHGKLTAPECAVYSNSLATDGLASLDDAVLSAEIVCTSGGYAGARRNFEKLPTTDCPAVEDPLSDRAPPPVGNCDATNLVVKAKTVTLKPGTYCGGIDAQSKSVITFEPGIYVIKDGSFDADSNSVATGDGVSFYFTGKGSRFTFDNTTEIDFKAPETGPMAGILFFQDPASDAGTVFEISSKRALNLLGTIYLPRATLLVNANNKIAEASNYTVIVANKLEISKYSELVINSDYASTAVPVPKGLESAARSIALVK
jgi:Flp pilus assembly protein TadG